MSVGTYVERKKARKGMFYTYFCFGLNKFGGKRLFYTQPRLIS